MTTFFILLGLFGGIVIAISIAGYRYYSGKTSEQRHFETTGQQEEIKTEVDLSKNELLKGQDDIDSLLNESKTQNDNNSKDILSKIEETSSKNESQHGEIIESLAKFSSHSYKPLDKEIKEQITSKLTTLRTNYINTPILIIEIEAGSSARDKVAKELESMLYPHKLGVYPKGNTFMGRFPDYPISIFYNPSNNIFVTEIFKIINEYIVDGIYFLEDPNFSNDHIRIYLNGNPEFYNNGTVKLN